MTTTLPAEEAWPTMARPSVALIMSKWYYQGRCAKFPFARRPVIAPSRSLPQIATLIAIMLLVTLGWTSPWASCSTALGAGRQTNSIERNGTPPSQGGTQPSAQAAVSSVRFAVIGDYGSPGKAAADVSDLVKSWKPDLIITTGDNNYPIGAEATIDVNIGRYYGEFISPYAGRYGPGSETLRFFPSLGNHDWEASGANPYLNYFSLPGNERYYSFSWGPVTFLALDSDPREPDGVSVDSKQAEWLRQGLADASESCWKVVYMHHPPFSSGPHGPAKWMQWPYASWGADAVLAGHDHTYERVLSNGIPYFVNGLGGRSIYQFETTTPESQVRFNGDYGAMLVEADGEKMSFIFITRTGDIVDRHTVHKDCAQRSEPELASFFWMPLISNWLSRSTLAGQLGERRG